MVVVRVRQLCWSPAPQVKEQGSKYRPMMVDFLLPESEKDNGENPIVDSLAVVGEWSIVAK